jgi:hypothetical protein
MQFCVGRENPAEVCTGREGLECRSMIILVAIAEGQAFWPSLPVFAHPYRETRLGHRFHLVRG